MAKHLQFLEVERPRVHITTPTSHSAFDTLQFIAVTIVPKPHVVHKVKMLNK